MNRATTSGGTIYVLKAYVSISNSNFTNNRATKFGGSIFVDRVNISIYGGNHSDNQAEYGAGIYIQSGSVNISSCSYSSNIASIAGGVMCAVASTINSVNSHYTNNSASQGGVFYISQLQTSQNNRASIGGSTEVGSVSISGGYITDNQAELGAVILLRNTSVYTISCLYSNNRASGYGGVMSADYSSIKSVFCYYTNNSAPIGGVFFIIRSSLQTSQSYYTNNTALTHGGGAIFSTCSEPSLACTIVSSGSYYMNNSASQAGGAILTEMYNFNASDDCYSYNYAVDGGAMSHQQGTVYISGSSFSNNFATSGGAINSVHSLLSISYSNFTDNSGIGGGALICDATSLTMSHSNYTNNQAEEGGAILIDSGISVTCSNCYFVNNNALLFGGAISGQSKHVACTSCYFKENQAKSGGAIMIGVGNVSSVNSFYSNNVAVSSTGGAIYVDTGCVSISGSIYTGNLGGAIYIQKRGSIFSSDSSYINNTSPKGGVMYVNEGNVYSNGSEYYNNNAEHGGAIYVFHRGTVSCLNDYFKYNRAARYGGAIFGWTNSVVFSSRCLYEDNVGYLYGGAIFSYSGVVASSDTNYTNNYSVDFGGAVFVVGGNISNTDSRFVENTAHRAGGAICALLSNIYSERSLYGNNHADEYGGAIYTDSCLNTNSLSLYQLDSDDKLDLLLATTKLICNEYSNYLAMPSFESTKLELSGSTVLTGNTCGFVGGAIIGIQVGVIINGAVDVPVVVNNNLAKYGGGLALVGTTLNIHSPIEFQDNIAKLSGGGIFSYKSDINLNLQSSQEPMSICGNTVSQNGGGVYAIDTSIDITLGKMHFEDNTASKGAAISLRQNSKILILKESPETVGECGMKLEFINNYAQYGGAVYVSDSSEDIIACERVLGSHLAQSSQECFIQTLLSNTAVLEDNTKINFFNVFFVNNTANVSGGAIYGGLLDRCSLNSSVELATQFPQYQQSTGFDYIIATAQFAGLVDYDNLTLNYQPDKLINNITASNVKGLISSEPVQVCFCLDNVHNCSYDHPNVYTKKGQLFRLSVVAVDQVGNPINAMVISSFVSNNGDLNVDQARQETTTYCTELEYNVYPKGLSNSSQIELYAEGPCSDIGISKRTLNVTFLPCTCPTGFQPVETKTQCTCDCDPILRPAYITNCSYADETVLRDSNAWIDYVNTTTNTGYLLYPNCPFDYCVGKPVNVNLNIPNGADIQCAFNRSGKLCGACKTNLSLMMGSSRCQQCSNSFISLLIPFAVAGIALVVFILILNVTVATGTINGLIFYANILVASKSLFIPFDTPKIFVIFISWINLDLGIETCFYDGMDSYAKVLLQLAFPIYIILITITIINISEYSIRFSTLIGKKDPVATLCTLLLLSYSKLIRTIIASLQYTYLDYPDGSSEIVWLYDANVPYFSPSHTPQFITAILIIVLGSVYTVLIFFGQWLQRCRNRKLVRCFNNPKYNAFIVKYHAPFNPKHRYWVGLLLLARIFHYLVSVFVSGTAVLLSVSCIVVGLVLLRLMNTTRTYKNWLLDNLDVTFLVNLVIFAIATYYVGESGGNQNALAATSLCISFITFLGVLIHHFYAYILKDTRVWGTTMQLLQRIVQVCYRHNEYERVPLEEDQESMDDDNEQHEQMIEMQPPYTDDDDNTDPINLPQDYNPPVIVPAVRYDQPREPDLDILDPITTDDYRQLNQPPAPRPQQIPTCTVIDFVRPHHSGDHRDHPVIVED